MYCMFKWLLLLVVCLHCCNNCGRHVRPKFLALALKPKAFGLAARGFSIKGLS